MENIFNENNFEELRVDVERLKEQIGKYIVGQDDTIENIIIAALCGGHILIEGVPGIAKTLMAKLFAKAINADFKRIQFTPDLMPSDIIGTNIFNAKISDFEFKKGPLFGNIILTDEINRSPAKTQAALFEVMEEKQITVEGNTYKSDLPFIVIATQNPIDHEGTYKLPEAQLDRFMFKLTPGYPDFDQELEIINRHDKTNLNYDKPEIQTVFDKQTFLKHTESIKNVKIEEKLKKYIVDIVAKTRKSSWIFLGASPRAGIAMLNAAKAKAAISGRDFVTPDDIKNIALPVLRHRIIITPEKEMEGMTNDKIIELLLKSVEVPR